MCEIKDLKKKMPQEMLEKIDCQEEYLEPTRLVEALDGYSEQVIPPAEELIRYINESHVSTYGRDTQLLKMLLDYHQAILHLKLEGQDGTIATKKDH